jgi:hypothetical protein
MKNGLAFEIFYKGRKVGETTAVSADKAKTNYWWNNCKHGDKFAYTEYKPSDFVARLKGGLI